MIVLSEPGRVASRQPKFTRESEEAQVEPRLAARDRDATPHVTAQRLQLNTNLKVCSLTR